MENFEPIRVTFGDSLSYGHLRQACYTLRNGGLCILPSDTCYSLAALPFRRDAIVRLCQVLPEKKTEQIPLAFGSLALVEQYVKLTARDYRLIDHYCPGPLTLVCKIGDKHDKKIVADMLHTFGTIGVRIPDSPIERQISTELQRPITTCAIRKKDSEAVRNFGDAVTIVQDQMRTLGEEHLLFAVRIRRIKYSDLSTVFTTQEEFAPKEGELVAPYSVYIFRPGVIEPQELKESLCKISFSDIEEWT